MRQRVPPNSALHEAHLGVLCCDGQLQQDLGQLGLGVLGQLWALDVWLWLGIFCVTKSNCNFKAESRQNLPSNMCMRSRDATSAVVKSPTLADAVSFCETWLRSLPICLAKR